jgi:hypothetical protein
MLEGTRIIALLDLEAQSNYISYPAIMQAGLQKQRKEELYSL